MNSVGLLLKCKQQPPFAAMYKARVFAYLECNLPYVHSLLISCSLPRGFNKEILKCCYDERNVKPPLTKQLEMPDARSSIVNQAVRCALVQTQCTGTVRILAPSQSEKRAPHELLDKWEFTNRSMVEHEPR